MWRICLYLFIFVDTCSYLFICGDICLYLFIFIDICSYLLYYSYVVIFIYIYWYLFIFVHIYSYVVIFVDICLYLLIFVHIGWYLWIAVDRFSLILDRCRYMLMLLRECLMLSIPFIWIASGMHWQSLKPVDKHIYMYWDRVVNACVFPWNAGWWYVFVFRLLLLSASSTTAASTTAAVLNWRSLIAVKKRERICVLTLGY